MTPAWKEGIILKYFRENLAAIEIVKGNLGKWLKYFGWEFDDDTLDLILEQVYETVDVVLADTSWLVSNNLIPLHVMNGYALVTSKEIVSKIILKTVAH